MESRMDCPHCSDTRQRLYYREIDGGTLWFCHNCGYKRFEKRGNRTPSETITYINQYVNRNGDKECTTKEIRLPKDFSFDIPKQAYFWLKKYDIYDEEIESFGIGWSESYQRLILPVYNDGQLIYWQGRSFKPITKDNPKYLNIRQGGARNIFFKRFKSTESICIVEDILSAIKVGRFVSSLALLGSYFPSELIPLYRRFSSVFVWLDNDKYTTAIKEAIKINSLSGLQSRVIYTNLDPKEYSNSDISLLLEGTK